MWVALYVGCFSPNPASFRVTRSVASGTVSSKMQLMQTHVCVHVAILGEDLFAGSTLPGLCLRLLPIGACVVQLERFQSSEPLAEQVVGVPMGVGRRLGVLPLRSWFRDVLLDVVSLIFSIVEAASRRKLAVQQPAVENLSCHVLIRLRLPLYYTYYIIYAASCTYVSTYIIYKGWFVEMPCTLAIIINNV